MFTISHKINTKNESINQSRRANYTGDMEA